MASVSSLDQDMKKLRLSRYTQSSANEARAWIESTLQRPLPQGDLLESLKDGVALCELANLVLPAPIKFKRSAMPFVQMENISHFLRACELAPLNLPAHDRFLTVDLYEGKDPAQVLQCLGAFSRQAHAANPARFTQTIGPKKSGVISPATTGNAQPRALSPAVTGSSQTDRPAVSSWSTKADQGKTAPAWNPVMYGYMGGADQAKQGVSFGSRRQITSALPVVPTLAEKEKRRREKEAEEERQLQERRAQREQEERLAVETEQRQWEEETARAREEERLKIEAQKREWEEQERQWQETEERRRKDEASLSTPKQTTLKKPPERPRTPSGNILRGQTLTEYQREQAAATVSETPEQQRVKELEQQLAEARERERQYQMEREERLRLEKTERPGTAKSAEESELSWVADDRETIRRQTQQEAVPSKLSESVSAAEPEPVEPAARPLPEPLPSRIEEPQAPAPIPVQAKEPQALPPDPVREVPKYTPSSTFRSPFARPANRTEAFLTSSPAPQISTPRVSSTAETGDTANEQSTLRDQRIASQQKTQAGAWASKSLLEREMERERERQREWEAGQQATKSAARDTTQGSGPGQTWDVNTYGFTAGDSQNKGSSTGSGIAFGGRRQIIGPRPQP